MGVNLCPKQERITVRRRLRLSAWQQGRVLETEWLCTTMWGLFYCRFAYYNIPTRTFGPRTFLLEQKTTVLNFLGHVLQVNKKIAASFGISTRDLCMAAKCGSHSATTNACSNVTEWSILWHQYCNGVSVVHRTSSFSFGISRSNKFGSLNRPTLF